MNNPVAIPINVIYSEHISPNGRYHEWLSNRSPRFLQYREDWSAYPQRFEVPRFPFNLDIEPTNMCNLRCPFCYRTLAMQQDTKVFDSQGYLPIDLFQMILEQISENGKCMVPAIKLTHRGEPLLHPELPKLVRMSKEAGAIDVIVNTNGTCLTDEKSYELLNAGLDRMLFSFDSPLKKQYEAIRIGASYEAVLDNIHRFVALRNKLQKGNIKTLIRVGMVITDETTPYIQEFIKLFEPIADLVSFNRVHREIEVDQDGSYTNNNGERCNVGIRRFADSQLWQRMTINWNGEAEICCENYKQEYPLGNVRDIPISQIWHGKRFSAVRRLHQEGKWWMIPQCRKCTIPWMKEEL